MNKRQFLKIAIASIGGIGLLRFLSRWGNVSATSMSETPSEPSQFEVNKTEEEWRETLTPEEFYVLRQHGTERPYSSPLADQHADGTYVCAGCELPLFSSDTKFDSGTGWPSFYAPIEGAIGTSIDRSLLMTRTEVHCRRCGGHQGHVFDDGPPPTGKRYCINGVALNFIPNQA